jgi:hypothetical protein
MSKTTLVKSRHQAHIQQGCKCFYCQLPVWETSPEEIDVGRPLRSKLAKHLKCTAEHLVARQDGGKDGRGNIVAACWWCNKTRHRGRPSTAPDAMTHKANIAKLVAQGRGHPVVQSLSRRGPNWNCRT